MFFRDIEVTSPHRVILTVNAKGPNCDTHSTIRGVAVPKFTDFSEYITYADMVIGKVQKSRDGFTVLGTIVGGTTFE